MAVLRSAPHDSVQSKGSIAAALPDMTMCLRLPLSPAPRTHAGQAEAEERERGGFGDRSLRGRSPIAIDREPLGSILALGATMEEIMETLKIATSFGQESINMAMPILAEEIAAFEKKK